MKVIEIQTVCVEEFPNLVWVQVSTDEGVIGLGETFFGVAAVEAHIHEFIAPYLLGKNPLEIERHSQKLTGYVGRGGVGAEMRATSAIDVALWDLWGQSVNLPIYQLLGGASRESIRVYNTCAGYKYVRKAPAQTIENFGLGQQIGPYEDLDAFLNSPEEPAVSLLDMGISAMKIWPFDFAAEQSGGTYISKGELKLALEPFKKVRRALGNKIELMAELHSLWSVPTATQICKALDEFEPTWIEDPIRMDNLEGVTQVCINSKSPIAGGELLGQRFQYKQILQKADIGVIIMDLVWGGGLTEARKVASMCDSFGVPFAAHDCTGPVALAASTHLALHAPNVFVQEIVRAFYFGWYQELVTKLPPIDNGFISVPEGPGLGLNLKPEVFKRKDVSIRRTGIKDI